jgi:hypothetical protein
MKKCPECQEPVNCGAESGQKCWCSNYPPIVPVDASKSCLCESCLKKKIKLEIEQFVQAYKDGKVENIAPKFATAEFVEGIDFYIEKEYRVMTEWYHLKRGYCCKSGCRHCPYGFRKERS